MMTLCPHHVGRSRRLGHWITQTLSFYIVAASLDKSAERALGFDARTNQVDGQCAAATEPGLCGLILARAVAIVPDNMIYIQEVSGAHLVENREPKISCSSHRKRLHQN